MKRIAVVGIYSDFYKHVVSLYDNYPGAEVALFPSDSVENAIQQARKAEQQQYDAIVCSGFTFDAVIGTLSIPIVGVEPTFYDAVNAFHQVLEKEPKGIRAILLLYYRNPMLKEERLKEILEDLFEIRLAIIQYKSIKEYEALIRDNIGLVDCVVGGAYAKEICDRLGIRGTVLSTSLNTLRLGVEEAFRVCEVRRQEALKKSQLEAVLTSSNEGIIYVNSDASIEMINPTATHILRLPDMSDAIGKPLTSVLPNSNINRVIESKEQELESIYAVGDAHKIMLNMIPVVVQDNVNGVVVTFKDVTQLIQMEKKIRADLHKKGNVAKYCVSDIIGNSESMTACISLVKRFGMFDGNVLINGETGTGKELLAQSIHNESPRRNEPFYGINCAALPDQLLESELFGYTEGSFTGAKKGGKPGLFELAHGGTIYLDEIGEMSLACQSMLLRALQEKEIRRIGDTGVTPVDVRIIAASHKNLQREVLENRFREDLYYRINVMNLTVPPLRERKQDIPLLLHHYMRLYSRRTEDPRPIVFGDEAMEFLVNYPWRGNVRELQNFVQRVYAYGICGKIVTGEEVEHLLYGFQTPLNSLKSEDENGKSEQLGSLDQITLKAILETLERFNWNQTRTAKHLGVSRTYIWRKLRSKEKV